VLGLIEKWNWDENITIEMQLLSFNECAEIFNKNLTFK
jgi:hypothetical protein